MALTPEQLQEAADFISGTCMQSPSSTLTAVLDRTYTEEELDEFEEYLSAAGIFECDRCGWYTYSGEGDGTNCDQCCVEIAEEE